MLESMMLPRNFRGATSNLSQHCELRAVVPAWRRSRVSVLARPHSHRFKYSHVQPVVTNLRSLTCRRESSGKPLAAPCKMYQML